MLVFEDKLLSEKSGETVLTEFTSHDGDMLSLVLDNKSLDEEVLLRDCDRANSFQVQRSCCSSARF